MTMKELIEKAQRHPSRLRPTATNADSRKSKKRRTRRRVTAPKQTYLYAAQRQALERQGKLTPEETASSSLKPNEPSPIAQARELGLVNPAAQHADALVDTVEPEIMAQIRVGDKKGTSGSLAYIIYKPAGWSILGSGGKKKASGRESADEAAAHAPQSSDDTRSNARVEALSGSASVDEDEFLSLLDPEELEHYDQVMKLLTLEEREEYMRDLAGDDTTEDSNGITSNMKSDDSMDTGDDGWDVLEPLTDEECSGREREFGSEAVNENTIGIATKVRKGSRVRRVKVKEEDGSVDILEYDERDVLALMTPEELEEFNAEGGIGDGTGGRSTDHTMENVQRIEARSTGGRDEVSFASPTRPSVVAWLKDLKTREGTPIRGGKYWTAISGATNVDDTGLVLICPKEKIDSVFVEYAKYVAVVGNGKFLAPKSKTKDPALDDSSLDMKTVSKLRKGRDDDVVLTVGVTVVETQSTCNSLVQPCQSQFQDGIRGDPVASPLDRRASRRLLHCKSLSVSSLVHDDTACVETDELPDDIAILSERRNKHEYVDGSFLGREGLRQNPKTTAYREINGAADGFQGWTVDRYGKWLVVQHDGKCYKGPLPSIHDGKTTGVYHLPSNPNRGAMGSREGVRPILFEGQPAPDVVPILENGVTYHVSLDKDLSTGIFLDQRPQRAWLAQNCNEGTRVLNCFAHCGAFSVAAASAGASTVSLDLNKRWLDRIEAQMEANGIQFDERHDCIYGDCFDWLARLSKRGEKYDIVILDPPSSSVGKTKKRWSVKNDMASLVELAAPLVKKGGLLWTTTNHAGINPVKFARMCRKGLDDAGLQSAKLERVAPMPVDFPCIGPQPVKNLVWRIPH